MGQAAEASDVEDTIFAVVDLETTGVSPIVGDRIIEIAILRARPDGSIVDEYATVVNPCIPVSPSQLHGIEQEDVAGAPTFDQIVGDVAERLRDLIMVGHNVKYQRDFLAAEFTAAGVFLPSIPCLCTLKLARRLHPELVNHRKTTCCSALGVDHAHAHEALEEARATDHLLRHYLQQAQAEGIGVGEVLERDVTFPASWPSLVPSGKVLFRTRRDISPIDPFLARLAAGRSDFEMDENTATYLDLLERALEDRLITEREAKALEETALGWGMSDEEVCEANELYLRGLILGALADGWITSGERYDLHKVAALLRVDPLVLNSLLADAAEDPP